MGTVVEFGSELKGFQQFEDYVAVQIIRRFNGEESVEETQVPWLVGTDGAHSIVRKTLDLPFLGETRLGDEMVFGDIKVEAGLNHYEVSLRLLYRFSFVLANRIIFLCSSGRDGVYHQKCTYGLKIPCPTFQLCLSMDQGHVTSLCPGGRKRRSVHFGWPRCRL